jgi:hypothetical protein
VFLTVSSATTSSLAICRFGVPQPATPASAAPGPSAARPRPGTIQMSRTARLPRDPAGVQLAVHRGGQKGRQGSSHPAGPCWDRRRRRRVTGQAATTTAGIQPTAMMGVQLCCLMASTIELTATSTAASAAMAYSHRFHGLMSNIPSVKCPCHDGPVRCGAPRAGRCSLIWTVGADRGGSIARRGRYGWNLLPGAAAARPWRAASKEVGQGRHPAGPRPRRPGPRRSPRRDIGGCFRQFGRGSSVWLAPASRAAVRPGEAGRRNAAPVPAPGRREGCSPG